ncbi:MAG: flagellar biosynthesis anti-sigma factor FlgM [Candidatus Hydrogenedentota bacterium]
MVNINGISGVPDPKPDRNDKVRNGRAQDVSSGESQAAAGSASGTDGVSISSEARAASEAARVTRLSQSQDDIRADKVAAAREFLERGDYKNPEVVGKVAERLLKYLS